MGFLKKIGAKIKSHKTVGDAREGNRNKREERKATRKQKRWDAKERRISLRQKGKSERAEGRSERMSEVLGMAKDTLGGIFNKGGESASPEASSGTTMAESIGVTPTEEKSKMPLIIGGVLVVVVGIFFMTKKKK